MTCHCRVAMGQVEQHGFCIAIAKHSNSAATTASGDLCSEESSVDSLRL